MQLTPSIYWPLLAGGAVLLYAYASYDGRVDGPDSMVKWHGSQHVTGVSRDLVKAQRLVVNPDKIGHPFAKSRDIDRLA